MSMLLETISPALSALLGGLIVMLSNLLIQGYKEKEKKKIFLRERLEEIYTLSLCAIDWLKNEDIKMRYFVEHSQPLEREEIQLRTDRLRMMINLYFEELIESVKKLDETETLFHQGMVLVYTSSGLMRIEDYEGSVGNAVKALLVVHFELRDRIKELIKICM